MRRDGLTFYYSATDRTITITFENGAVYIYLNRAWTVWRDLKAASSPRQFIARNLTPQGNYRRIK